MKISTKSQIAMKKNMDIVKNLYNIAKKNSNGSLQETIIHLDMIEICLRIFTSELKDLERKKTKVLKN